MRLKIYPASLLEIHIKQERAEKTLSASLGEGEMLPPQLDKLPIYPVYPVALWRGCRQKETKERKTAPEKCTLIF